MSIPDELASTTATHDNHDNRDNEMIRRAQQGDRQAMEELFLQHLATVHRFALRMCRDEERARDIAQESLLTALKSLGSFRAEASFSTWLFAITRSHCGRWRRRASRENLYDSANLPANESVSYAPGPDTIVAQNQLSSIVDQALDALEPSLREVILLRDIEGMSNPQAANVLQLSVNALKSRLHRARAALRLSVHQIMNQRTDLPNKQCPEVVLAFSRKLEGELSDTDCSIIQQHVDSCPDCFRRCEAVKQILGACATLRSNSNLPEMKMMVQQTVNALQTETT